jgi:2-hydroxychromene-2-carboxylate isomerase
VSKPNSLEFFFDFSSPWTYMALAQVQTISSETVAQLVWKPFYVAAVFREVNHHVGEMRAHVVPAKLAYYKTDMDRWARRLGIRIERPPVYGGGSQPLNSAAALRGAFFAMEHGRISQYALGVFRAYWEELEDISDHMVLTRLAVLAGLDEQAFAGSVDSAQARAKLAANTAEFIQRGGFGTPTFFVNGQQMFFGNDRLVFVRDALLGEPA